MHSATVDKKVGVLFFHDEPRTFIPGAQIDVVIFPDGPGGDVLVEKEFHGPLHEQVRDALRYVESSVIREKVIKHKDRLQEHHSAAKPLTDEAADDLVAGAALLSDSPNT